jgi:hypothetical protein
LSKLGFGGFTMKNAWIPTTFTDKEWTPGAKDNSSFKAPAGPSSLDRRQFLKTAGQTASTLAAVTAFAPAILSAESPAKTICVGYS